MRGVYVRKSALVLVIALTSVAIPSANHSWGGYHWARQSNPFTLKLGDNVSSAWDAYLAQASTDWSNPSGGYPTVLTTQVVTGSANPKNCRPTSGRVEVCSSTYGNNGWLGVAQIWITGGTHITQGTVKLNDTYFRSGYYNTPDWRGAVACQEIGHTFGLDHQDENFNNNPLYTCMDYQDPPFAHPNDHDFEELALIYTHLDSTTTVSLSTASSKAPPAMNDLQLDAPGQWGRLVAVSRNGKFAKYEADFGGGHKVVTFVFWA